MKKILVLVIAMITSITAMAQSDFKIEKEKGGYDIYKGELTFKDLNGNFDWMEDAEKYNADPETVAFLERNLPNYKLVVFLGTWCPDSHYLIPQLYKVLEEAEYPMNQMKMYGVDRAKESKYFDHKTYKIVSVPTIIVMNGAFEVGRIVESAPKGIEKGLADIVRDHMRQPAE